MKRSIEYTSNPAAFGVKITEREDDNESVMALALPRGTDMLLFALRGPDGKWSDTIKVVDPGRFILGDVTTHRHWVAVVTRWINDTDRARKEPDNG